MRSSGRIPPQPSIGLSHVQRGAPRKPHGGGGVGKAVSKQRHGASGSAPWAGAGTHRVPSTGRACLRELIRIQGRHDRTETRSGRTPWIGRREWDEIGGLVGTVIASYTFRTLTPWQQAAFRNMAAHMAGGPGRNGPRYKAWLELTAVLPKGSAPHTAATPHPQVGPRPSAAGPKNAHLFKVESFRSSLNEHILALHGFGEHLDALQGMQVYYDKLRGMGPNGETTPEVQDEDWKFVELILGGLVSSPEFGGLPANLRHSILALQRQVDQPGSERYAAWTAMCRALKYPGHSIDRGAGPIAAAPALTPVPPTRCEKAVAGLEALCRHFDAQTVANRASYDPTPQEWSQVQDYVAAIMSNQADFESRFPKFPDRVKFSDLLWFLKNERSKASLASVKTVLFS